MTASLHEDDRVIVGRCCCRFVDVSGRGLLSLVCDVMVRTS